ncbi:hypothetical protein ACN4FI_16535 [Acinetobacter baumannii]|uniref:hypothetical protein n=1 Tax=Acinetobacter baumannii TaxID=470 RepID=UPI0024B26960|nr:hypothetical protein [Acinetobacter baumannii]WFT60659.1 hypothetical protein MTS25_05535 [Acinetobacter baumannii]
MDKCREEFEKQRYWIGLFRADVDFDVTLGEFGRYVSNGSRRVDAMCLESFNEKWEAWANAWQSQQAKVEGLKATIKGNHGRIAELERLNRVKAQAILDLHQEIKELKASHHGEVIGHEVHLKKIKQERDELQTLYTQQGINMFKLQKRVDAVIIEIENMYLSGAIGFDTVKKLEQALKGDQYDEHRKKAEEAISKGASLTNHRIEL